MQMPKISAALRWLAQDCLLCGAVAGDRAICVRCEEGLPECGECFPHEPHFDAVIAAFDFPVMLVRDAPRRLADLTEPRDLTLLVGPEGGWTERELALAEETAKLGPRNLRVDTAALVGLAVALAARRD